MTADGWVATIYHAQIYHKQILTNIASQKEHQKAVFLCKKENSAL